MTDQHISYESVPQAADCEEGGITLVSQPKPKNLDEKYGFTAFLCSIIIILLTSNIVLYTSSFQSVIHDTPRDPPTARHRLLYASLGCEKPLVEKMEGYRNPIYAAEDRMVADEAWNKVNMGHGVVVLDKTYAMGTLGLPEGFPWEWDATKSTYIIAAYHAMHCVALVRRALVAGSIGEMTKHQRDHSLHCIDALREEIMCTSDRTILKPGGPGYNGRGMVRVCNDWEKLRDWATENSAGFMRAENGSSLLNVFYPDTDGWQIL